MYCILCESNSVELQINLFVIIIIIGQLKTGIIAGAVTANYHYPHYLTINTTASIIVFIIITLIIIIPGPKGAGLGSSGQGSI